MTRLRPDKLSVNFLTDSGIEAPIIPRRYTLTHSDLTGELLLTIGKDYNYYNLEQFSGWYSRFMRDEVLAEWKVNEDGPTLHVYCHVSGGLVAGKAGWRYNIFQRELPLVLEAIRYGDNDFFDAHPEFDDARILVHFQASQPRYNKIENWGVPAEYKV